MTKRRNVLAGTAAAATAGIAAASSFPKPAIAQSAPELKWRLTSSFPSRSTRSTARPRCSPRPWPR